MNRRLYLIAFSRNIREINTFKDRINNLGQVYYLFDENIVLLSTELTAQQIYQRLSENGYEEQNIFIIKTDNTFPNYFGWMPTALWTWIEEQRNHNDN